MLQGWRHKVVAILLYHDCNSLVGTSLTILTRSLQVVNSLFQTCWQLVTSRANTTCWRLVCRLATSRAIFTCVQQKSDTVTTMAYTNYTATNLLQVVNSTGLSQPVNKLQQTCHFHQVATSLLESGLLQLVICRLVTTCWNNLRQACCQQVWTINLQQVCWQLATDHRRPNSVCSFI